MLEILATPIRSQPQRWADMLFEGTAPTGQACADISARSPSWEYAGWHILPLILIVAAGCGQQGSTSQTEANNRIHGRVLADSHPVHDARVRIKGQPSSVMTDDKGYFELAEPIDPRSPQTVTAWKAGFFIQGQAVDQLPVVLELEPLPTDDDENYEWVDPSPDETSTHNCANCHAEIYREWKQDGHAQSANNPHFLNLYAGTDWHGQEDNSWGLIRDYPEGAGVCNACHVPAAGLEELAVADVREIQGLARQGVHCDFCHKIQDVATDAVGLAHGRFGLSLLRPSHGQLFFGPLDDVDRGEDAYSPLFSQSRYCASCHEGIVFGVHVYSTYSEWLESPAARAGKQCQNCHMRPTGHMTNIAPNAGGIERDPMTLASHTFLPGGREAMLRQCLDVSIDTGRDEKRVHVRVDIRTHDVGHRVPTGFIDRHLVLVVEATRAGATIDLLSGPVLPPPAGNLAGRPGRLFGKLTGNNVAPFWRLDSEIVDTRLEPESTTTTAFEFPLNVNRLRVRLIYRRFWDEIARSKKWPDNEIVILDESHTP